MIVAAFATESAMHDAAVELRQVPGCAVETYGATQPQNEEGAWSILPLVMLGGGMVGGLGGFGMQAYATTISYPLDIGGRPDFSWPSYIPATFELAVLGAVLAGIFGYFITMRLPRLYDPVDDAVAMRDVMAGGHVVVACTGDISGVREILSRHDPLSIEVVGS